MSLPIYRLNGAWKGRQVRDYPVLLLQVGCRMDAEIDTTNITYIAQSFGTCDSEATPLPTPFGMQFYFELNQVDVAARMKKRLREVGYADADFVGSYEPCE